MSHNNRSGRWKNAMLYIILLLGVLVTTVLAKSLLFNPTAESITWRYSQFVQSVENNQVERVNISTDRTQAVVITSDGQQVIVNLPDDPQLLDILTRHGVDVSISPQHSPFEVSNLLIPVGVTLANGVMLASVLFWTWVLIDCAAKEASEGNTKIVWVLIILLGNLLGAFVYFFVRRPQRLKELGQ